MLRAGKESNTYKLYVCNFTPCSRAWASRLCLSRVQCVVSRIFSRTNYESRVWWCLFSRENEKKRKRRAQLLERDESQLKLILFCVSPQCCITTTTTTTTQKLFAAPFFTNERTYEEGRRIIKTQKKGKPRNYSRSTP